MTTSNMISRKKIKILLFGYIDLNVMDGSALFLTSIAEMLSMDALVEIDLVLARPIKREIVLQTILGSPNIRILSPFEDELLLRKLPFLRTNERINHYEAGLVLDYYWNQRYYDWLFIRGIEVVEALSIINPNAISRSLVYLTGITHEDQTLTLAKKITYHSVLRNCAYIICQTHEMKSFLLSLFKENFEEKVITLYPTIPDVNNAFQVKKKIMYDKLVYTGRFDVNWNLLPIIISFKELREIYPKLELTIAGDHFKKSNEHPDFVTDLKYHLNNTTNLHWVGAINRNLSTKLVMENDIGIAWRDTKLDSSLELSTKVLEYGSLGKPVILNPTKMHKRILGEDYPLYAANREEFVNVLKNVISNSDIYQEASQKLSSICRNYTYSQTLKYIMRFL